LNYFNREKSLGTQIACRGYRCYEAVCDDGCHHIQLVCREDTIYPPLLWLLSFPFHKTITKILNKEYRPAIEKLRPAHGAGA
jgi:hypothetical protein